MLNATSEFIQKPNNNLDNYMLEADLNMQHFNSIHCNHAT